jgi:hypothetical protein
MGPPKTENGVLKTLPQFRPSQSFDIDHIDRRGGSSSAFQPERVKEIKRVLTHSVQAHVRIVDRFGEPTGVERFLREAVKAIEIYEIQRKVEPFFDRKNAKVFLIEAADAVRVAQRRLQAIAAWSELSSFLEKLFAAVGESKPSKFTPSDATSSRKRLFSTLEPKLLAHLLFQVEPLLTLAAEQVQFQPGDFQRDDATRDFVDAMAYAWICCTGRLPTYSTPSTRSRKSSPFANLMTTVNEKVLSPEISSPNNFSEYGQASVRRMKTRFPELDNVSAKPRHKRGVYSR